MGWGRASDTGCHGFLSSIRNTQEDCFPHLKDLVSIHVATNEISYLTVWSCGWWDLSHAWFTLIYLWLCFME